MSFFVLVVNLFFKSLLYYKFPIELCSPVCADKDGKLD